ncbi:hypothetical protein ABMA28_011781 [Loxostege sticticalis]|uniref:Gustatory receptor n=1 Tax=Loxostege sticticalis TaxID=481309 RepID=A0ABD0TKH0_LOXSC
MKLLLIYGQFIGLNPVIRITNMDVSKMRFTFCSLRFMYCCLIGACQLIFTALHINRFVRTSVTITSLSYVSFYAGTFLTTALFLRIAANWPALMKKIANSSLDKYIDATLPTKCLCTTVIMLSLALFEHVLSQNTKLMNSIHCATENVSAYEIFLGKTFPWFKELQGPINLPIGVFFHIMNIISTITWSYSDVFLVCMSLYLVSIIDKINKTINEVDHRFYHPTFWSTIREDYTRAADLVTSFDDVISGLMLISFASNLFFICLQLFHILSSRGMWDNLIYFTFSLIFVLVRYLAVSLAAASIHTASQKPAAALYMIPSTAYCSEVQRFIEQVHGSCVALTGLKFFYVTKGLVLSVAGTIVTYELVLLQFNGENN